MWSMSRSGFGAVAIAAGILLHTVHPFGGVVAAQGAICTAHAQGPLPCVLCCTAASALIALGFAAIESAARAARNGQITYGSFMRRWAILGHARSTTSR